MRLFDVSVPLTDGMPTYPGNARYTLTPVKRVAKGDSSNVSALSLGTHSGTHVDAPRHFFDDRPGIDGLPLDVLIGRARVVEIAGPRRGINARDFDGVTLDGETRVLLKTGNSALWASREFQADFAFLDEGGARFLLERGVRLVGVDYLSIEQFKRPGAPVHHLLLDRGVVIVEGLNLNGVAPGPYEMFCLPLDVVGGDGAPARVVLRDLPAGSDDGRIPERPTP
jgi:arylformamidase